jgi:hypothetical protein
VLKVIKHKKSAKLIRARRLSNLNSKSVEFEGVKTVSQSNLAPLIAKFIPRCHTNIFTIIADFTTHISGNFIEFELPISSSQPIRVIYLEM